MNNKTLICPICDNPTRVYMGNARKDGLCGKHADMLKAGECEVNVYSSEDSWYGVTYKEDKPFVVECIAGLKEKGIYPKKLNV